jgi:hypothetical protein
MKKASAEKIATRAINDMTKQKNRARELAQNGKTPGEKDAGVWALKKIENRIRLMVSMEENEKTSAIEVARLGPSGHNYKVLPSIGDKVYLKPQMYTNFKYKNVFGIDEAFIVEVANPIKNEIVVRGIYASKKLNLSLTEFYEFFRK